MTTTAAQIMTAEPQCVRSGETVATAARRMAELGVGSLPIVDRADQVIGMLTDRDIVVQVVAEDRDSRSVDAGELAQGYPVTVQVNDSAERVMQTMRQHKVRRLPVLDGTDLVGIVSQADVARSLSDVEVGDLLAVISTDD